jgi:hypothetical protein
VTEHDERDEWFGAVEPEGDAGEEPDPGVGRFDRRVREVRVESVFDRGAVPRRGQPDAVPRGPEDAMSQPNSLAGLEEGVASTREEDRPE